MIGSDLDHAYASLRWLAQECSHNAFASRRLSTQEFAALSQELLRTDEKHLKSFFGRFFDAFALRAPQWTPSPSHHQLPMLVLLPGKEMGVIIANDPDGSWRCETPEGVISYRDFPKKTLFTPIKAQRRGDASSSAAEMFKKIALLQKSSLIYAAVASLSINLFALATSFYSMQVYDRVIPTGGISTLVALSVGVFIAVFLEMILKLSRASILDHASKNMDIAYSHNIFARFLNIRSDALPKSVGTLSGQLQSYGTVRAFISSAAMYLIIDFPFSILFLSVIVMIAGWSMGLIALGFLVLAVIAGTLFRQKIETLSATSTMASHKKLGLLVETVENAENVKATGAGWSILGRWNALSEDAIHDDIEIRYYSEMSTYLSAFLQQVSYIALVAVGAYLVSTTDTLTMGGLIAVTILSGRVLSPIAMIPNLLVQWGRTKMAIKDLNNVYALAQDNQGVERPISPEVLEPLINCINVKFAYGKEMATISLPKLTIRPGEKVAILGAIGSGKSTVLKLLSGLYSPQEGQVHLGGIDIQQISRSRLNEVIGYLPQSVKLFSGTLRDNLLLGLIGFNDEQILDAAKKTGLITLINTLPQGLDTQIPEGGESVSGGQKQLIALTRILLASPSVWLLDEPTSNMDDGTERNIMNVIAHATTENKTLIVVTHKPALLALVNRVIVMAPQGIVMDGPRDTILQELKNRSQNGPQGDKR
jgi:ATP-binding cassette, subfamily C, bacterial LapB